MKACKRYPREVSKHQGPYVRTSEMGRTKNIWKLGNPYSGQFKLEGCERKVEETEKTTEENEEEEEEKVKVENMEKTT